MSVALSLAYLGIMLLAIAGWLGAAASDALWQTAPTQSVPLAARP